VVASTDFLLEGRHFRRDWSGPADVGRKAAARSLIDVAAMGAVATGLLVALAAPGDLPVSWARGLAEGLAAECARAGASVVGGDTARASSVLLAVTGLGDLQGRAPVLRSGAAPGDLVAVAGPLGLAAAGLALLSAGLSDDPAGSLAPDPLLTAHRRPHPPYDAGPEAADLGATAMIDISDGLLADLGHIADASGVLIDVSAAALAPGELLLAASRAVREAAGRHDFSDRTDRGSSPEHADALAWVLTGGEDHALAATFPPSVALPPRWSVIGQVLAGHGILVDGRPWAGPAGWDHFAVLATGDEPESRQGPPRA
jgi:thiamine-monophosphate kinase